MQALQGFELALAVAVVKNTAANAATPKRLHAERASRRVHQMARSAEHGFTKASASENKNSLGERIPEALRERIDALIARRNEAAHRLFRTWAFQAPDGGNAYAPGAERWLAETMDEAYALATALQRAVPQDPEGTRTFAHPAVEKFASVLAESFVSGKPVEALEDLVSKCVEAVYEETGPPSSHNSRTSL